MSTFQCQIRPDSRSGKYTAECRDPTSGARWRIVIIMLTVISGILALACIYGIYKLIQRRGHGKVSDNNKWAELADADVFQFINNESVPRVLTVGAPWCTHCQAMHALVDNVQAAQPPQNGIHFLTVDGTKLPEIIKHFDISAVPSVWGFRRGDTQGIEFQGDRTLATFNAFCAQLN